MNDDNITVIDEEEAEETVEVKKEGKIKAFFKKKPVKIIAGVIVVGAAGAIGVKTFKKIRLNKTKAQDIIDAVEYSDIVVEQF